MVHIIDNTPESVAKTLEEATVAAKSAAAAIGGNFEQGIGFTQAPITPTSITPIPPSNFQTTPPPADVAVPPAPKPEPVISEVDKRLQAESDKALKASNASAGRFAFQAEQDIAAGIPEQQKLVRELSARIQSVSDQATGEQLKAEDRLAPQFAIAGEQASIERSRAIQALTLNSQLAAAQGNLQNAIDLSDRAVEAKFGPIEAKLETSLRNLDIIRNSPNFTASQKAKAEATAEKKRKELAQVALDKQDAKQVSEFTANIIALNPTIDAVTAEALSKASNIVEASQIAVSAGLDFEEAENLQFISGTKNQPAGTFNKVTGVFTPTGGTGNGDEPVSDRDHAQNIIDANSEALDSELKDALLAETDLTVTEINSILANRVSSRDLVFEAEELTADFFDKPSLSRLLPGNQTLKAFNKAKTDAIADIRKGGVIEIDGKQIRLTPEIQEQIIAFINSVSQKTIEEIAKNR